MVDPTAKRAALAQRLRARTFTLAPGVFDLISAKSASAIGFDCLYMTGYGVSASHLGLPDAGLSTYTDMLGRARAIADSTPTPLIADADTGYGGLLNMRHTVHGYEAGGVSGIQIEDQEFPKKCGHTPGRRVIPLEEMTRKIEVAVEARRDPNFLIVARTDSRTTLGIDEAIRRGQTFAKAGADVIFIESPETEDEFKQIGQAIDAPLLANMVDGGRSPVLSQETLEIAGFTIAIYPGTGFLATTAALMAVYSHLKQHGGSQDIKTPLYDINDMHRLMGFEEVWEFEQRWPED